MYRGTPSRRSTLHPYPRNGLTDAIANNFDNTFGALRGEEQNSNSRRFNHLPTSMHRHRCKIHKQTSHRLRSNPDKTTFHGRGCITLRMKIFSTWHNLFAEFFWQDCGSCPCNLVYKSAFWKPKANNGSHYERSRSLTSGSSIKLWGQKWWLICSHKQTGIGRFSKTCV